MAAPRQRPALVMSAGRCQRKTYGNLFVLLKEPASKKHDKTDYEEDHANNGLHEKGENPYGNEPRSYRFVSTAQSPRRLNLAARRGEWSPAVRALRGSIRNIFLTVGTWTNWHARPPQYSVAYFPVSLPDSSPTRTGQADDLLALGYLCVLLSGRTNLVFRIAPQEMKFVVEFESPQPYFRADPQRKQFLGIL
jgi:hypothetical protein